ncbi:MAG: transglycosylase SLT domain-containing protein [Paludibacteraceae bacterium]|nr:transglycosylase SLT domain-containing protein [Paludibacteraceae bacterium]
MIQIEPSLVQKRKPIFEIFVLCTICMMFSSIGGAVTYFLMKDHMVSPMRDFSTEVPELENLDNNAYGFMPKEMSDYILSLCSEMNVDSNLVLSILLNENPMLDPTAVNRNKNSSVDLGLFQLNSAYVWTSFKKNYWKFDKDVEYDPFNYKINAYIAISHIKHLSDRMRVFDDIVMAYNCGENSVMKNRIPESTKEYLARAKKNYYLLTATQQRFERTHYPTSTEKTMLGEK